MPALLEVLGVNNQLLELVLTDFPSMIREQREGGRRLQVTCFFEELPMRVVGPVVPKESATLERSTALSIPAYHRDMVKFASVCPKTTADLEASSGSLVGGSAAQNYQLWKRTPVDWGHVPSMRRSILAPRRSICSVVFSSIFLNFTFTEPKTPPLSFISLAREMPRRSRSLKRPTTSFKQGIHQGTRTISELPRQHRVISSVYSVF